MIPNLQRIQIKLAADAPPGLKLDPFLEIFSRWRKETHPAEWVDLADYAHLPRGPGIVLIGQRCNVSFDLADPGPGILYAARKGLTGSHTERLGAAFQWCLEFSKRLLAEPEFPKEVRVRTDRLEIRFNDRLETPNTASTDAELRPAVEQVLNALFGAGEYQLTPITDPNDCYGLTVRAKKAESLDVLIARP
ncbi:MAG: hypothetical protein A3H28_17380 [Acidobacteria bacterium RIFCSPLOWO2_02_FULL_61_28]|nr:MAG: hypothetical protein A3H28_17380 [Acidobacteria bacterium RIFCSPLOWO2_02_FULL_61_28]